MARNNSAPRRSRFGISFILWMALCGYLSYRLFGLSENLWLGAGAGFLLYLLWPAFRRSRKRARLRKSGIDEIDEMEGLEFEHYLCALFQALGYRAEVTQGSGDYGADLLLYHGDQLIAVQAKRYGKTIGISAIQQVHSAQRYYEADEAWVVTNSTFTKAAKQLAASVDVKLIDRAQLIELMRAGGGRHLVAELS